MNWDQIADKIAEATKEDHAAVNRLLTGSLQLVNGRLPDVAASALSIADAYWFTGTGTALDLEDARVACWKFLDATCGSTKTRTPDEHAVRAVICVLYANPPLNDAYELIDAFLEFFAGATEKENIARTQMKILELIALIGTDE